MAPSRARGWLRALQHGRGRPLGAALLAGLLALVLGPQPRALRALSLAWFDAYQIVAPRRPASQPALVVEIDEASLARHGQWPWPRTLLARLLADIAAGRPAAIGVDLLMPEPDRLSPGRLPDLVPGLDPDLAARLARVESNDARLAAAIRGRPVVLGVGGLVTPAAAGPLAGPLAPVRVQGGDPAPLVRRFTTALRSVPEIDAAAAGHGLLNPDPDTRVVRRIPLVAAVGARLVPTLGLEMLRVASEEPGWTVRVGRSGVEAVQVGDLRVPTQPDGAVWLAFSPHDPDRFVSAAEVLAGRVAPGLFAAKLVIVGVTALGLGDHHVTPVGPMPGAEIHAQLLEDIFDGAVLARPRWAREVEGALLAAGGLALVLLVPAWRVRGSAALFLGEIAALVGLGFWLYARARVLLDAATPAAGLGLTFTVMLGVTLAEADRQRRALRRQVELEREAAARLAGELEAARRIQMGTLPDPARAFPGETRFQLYATLEPARVVGGDLYDFFQLGADRLFFLIGDVSGKGLPGSLFMAVSKALYKSTALRRADDVGAMMQEANAEIARDDAESLFVTLFAGILDARTGELSYCNAGHEAPYLLSRDGDGTEALAGGGGPPLCVVDDFPYAASTRQLARGDTLCLVTDGVTEATSGAGELYGRARLAATLAVLDRRASVEAVGGAIRASVARFSDGAEPSDDLAILVLRWAGPEGPEAEGGPLSGR